MKLSWSHKLFLKINNLVGKNSTRDKFMRFCATWLIVILTLSAISWIVFNFEKTEAARHLSKTIIFILIGYFSSLFIGLMIKHPRPKVELPEIKQLITPIGLWKSFPSDHAMISFSLVFLMFIYGIPLYFGIIMLWMAGLISISRVYVGVHYPRDIFGGFAFACILSLIFLYLKF